MKSLFAVILFSIFFISCSNVADVKVVSEKRETLKSVVSDKETNVSWAKELEGERLLENIYSDSEHISDYYYISPVNIIVSHKKDSAVYPELIGFGSLDTTDMTYSVKQLVNDFCKNLSENFYRGAEQYFDSNYYFSYVFFKNDLINNWKKMFGVDFPIKSPEEIRKQEEKEAAAGKLSDRGSENSLKSDKKSAKKEITVKENKQLPLFTKWIIGRPFSTEEITQVPVRFCCQQGYVDVTLYINLDNNKIFQIEEGPYAGKK